jgi:ubiquinone/menaquinone biosynthesis C-methylase UbiE
MPTISDNRIWNDKYEWTQDGDEWDDQAKFCGQPYNKWVESIYLNFIHRNLGGENRVALEIAPDHGRWTKYLIGKTQKLILVDMNPACIDFCKRKFKEYKNIHYHVNDGRNIPFVDENSVDFIWSYDSFVHMENDVIESYFNEFSRIMKSGGCAVIHHAGRRNFAIKFRFMKKIGSRGKALYNLISIGNGGWDGWRSDVSRQTIERIAKNAGLVVEYQVNSWGEENQYNVKLYRDFITKLTKP